MPHSEQGSEGGRELEGDASAILEAVIVRSDVIDGRILVRCPVDLSEFEVPADSKEIACNIDGLKLRVPVSETSHNTEHTD